MNHFHFIPIKSLTLLVFLFISLTRAGDVENLLEQYYRLIIHDGKVDYRIAQQTLSLRQQIRDSFEIQDREIQDTAGRIAFGINLYNFSVIEEILQQGIRTSVKEDAAFFSRKNIPWKNSKTSLDDLEKELLRLSGQDPRLHFVLICGAVSCPHFPSIAFRADQLEMQLNQATTAALKSDDVLRYDAEKNRLYLSLIFEWYTDDFENSDGGMRGFLSKYASQKIPDNAKIEYKKYNWQLNGVTGWLDAGHQPLSLQNFTAATLLFPGQWEVKYFGNVYTQTQFFNENGEKISAGGRQSYFTGILSFYYGAGKGINLGVDIWQKSARFGENSASPFRVLQAKQEKGVAASRLAFVVPKAKMALSRLWKGRAASNMTLETQLQIPLANDLEKAEGLFLDYQSWFWNVYLYNEIRLSSRTLLFSELASLIRLKAGDRSITTPMKLFFNYYPNKKMTIYTLGEVSPTWDGSRWKSYYLQMGAAAKWLLFPNLEIEGLYTKFLRGKSSGAGQTFNFGLRFLF